jgi:hypothetical protein
MEDLSSALFVCLPEGNSMESEYIMNRSIESLADWPKNGDFYDQFSDNTLPNPMSSPKIERFQKPQVKLPKSQFFPVMLV